MSRTGDAETRDHAVAEFYIVRRRAHFSSLGLDPLLLK
jgi:hypothetical protein